MDKDTELTKALQGVPWPIQYGSVKVQVKEGKPTIVTIERTVKID